jgi:hypothetical protein
MQRMTTRRRWWRAFATPGFADRGAVAVIVSVLLASGVLLGMAALSVDVGQLNAEREELISAADGAAQSIAVDCGRTPATCSTSTALATVLGRAAVVANENGRDGRNDITSVCGSGGALAPCDPATAPKNLTACLNAQPTDGTNFVEVHTATRTTTSTLLPTAFAGTFVSGYNGATLGACSRVAWGSPAGGLAVTFAECEWDQATANGTSYVDFPPNPPGSAEHVIYLHGKNASSCTNTPPSGWDAPGGFGWLDDNTGVPCFTAIAPNGTYPGDTGTPSGACAKAIDDAFTSHKPVLIPVYDGVKGTGANTDYHAAGVAAFVVTGYFFGNGNGKDQSSWLTGNSPCSGSDRCIIGFFVNALLPASSQISPGAPNLGATVIKTIG